MQSSNLTLTKIYMWPMSFHFPMQTKKVTFSQQKSLEDLLGSWSTSVKYHYFVKSDELLCGNGAESTNLTFDFLTPKSVGVVLLSWALHVWSIIIVCQKEMELLCRNYMTLYFSTDRRTDSHGGTSIQICWQGYKNSAALLICQHQICLARKHEGAL